MANWLKKYNPFLRAETKTTVPAPISANQTGGLFASLFAMNEILPAQAWGLYKNSSCFAKVVDLIADETAALKPRVKINGEIVEDHPILLFLDNPGCNRGRERLIKEMAVQYLVTGTCYLASYGNTQVADVPIMLDVLKTMFVNSDQDYDMWPRSYMYGEGMQTANYFRDRTDPRNFRWYGQETGANVVPGMAAFSEIVPIYDMDGDRRGIGMPRLNSIKYDVELYLKGIRHNSSLMDNGARLSGVVSVKGGTDEEQLTALSDDLNARISGPDNAGRVAVIGGGEMDFAQLSQSAKDMDFAKLIEIVENQIVARYGIPITLYRTSAQTDNNYEMAWKVLYRTAVLPCFKVLFSGLSRHFSNKLGVKVEIEHDALSNPVLQEQAIKQAAELYNAHLISRNEARAIFGYEDVLGGDTIYGSVTDVAQAEDYFTDHGINDPDADNSREAYHDTRPTADPIVAAGAESEARAAGAARGNPDKDKPAKKPAGSKKTDDATAVLLEFARHLKSWKPPPAASDKRSKAA